MNLQVKSFEEYQQSYQLSVDNPEVFWANIAEHFTWKKKWDRVLDWNFSEPKMEWFGGAKLNITENCLDRHLENNGDDIAIIWESNDPDEASRNISYRELHQQVCTFSNVLKQNGAKKGDRICLYMPMIPEAVIAMLAENQGYNIWDYNYKGKNYHNIVKFFIDFTEKEVSKGM